jgi:hypothetical protein
MSEEQFNLLLQFFKVLGNESRLKILGLLANGERSVGELAALLDLKEPTVSHHLAMMKELGLVTMRPEGNVHIYRLDVKSLENMSKGIFTQSNLATLVDESSDMWEQKVRQTFIEGQRIKAIPAQYKKQLVLLKWLVEKFARDKEYTEKEVNEIIKPHHPDTAWFRRSLIEEKFMAREKGIYWRLPGEPIPAQHDFVGSAP